MGGAKRRKEAVAPRPPPQNRRGGSEPAPNHREGLPLPRRRPEARRKRVSAFDMERGILVTETGVRVLSEFLPFEIVVCS